MRPRSFVRDSIGVALSQYLSRAMLLARAAAAAVTLGPAGMGAWNALNLILDYGAYASSGALQGLDLRLPGAVERGDRERARNAMAGAWSAVLLGGALFVLLVAVVLISGDRALERPWGGGAPALMLAAVLFQLAIHYHVSALRAHGDFGAVSGALSVQAVVGGGLGLGSVWFWGVWGLLWGWIAGSAVALVWLRRSSHPVPLRPQHVGEGLGLVRLGLPVFASFALSLVLRSLDRFALVRYAPPEALGQYSLGLMAAGLALYLPESAASVLYPRIAAAAHGGHDSERTRSQVLRTHRALAVVMPLLVGGGMLWAAPLTARLLPAFRDGIPALHVLALGALMLSAATVPTYYLLGTGRSRELLAVMAGATLLTAAMVFSVAARDQRPASIAFASSVGYATLALGLVGLAARRLVATGIERWRLVAGSFIPSMWAGSLALGLCTVGPPEGFGAAVLRSAAFGLGYLPVLVWLGRGHGLSRWFREGGTPS